MKTFISDCGFSFFSVNPLFYSALFFTDCNCSRTNVLRVRNWSSQCRTCVVPPPLPMYWRGCCVMWRAQLRVNDIAGAGRPALLQPPSYQPYPQAPQKYGAVKKGVSDGRWCGDRRYQPLRGGAMTHFHIAAILWCMQSWSRLEVLHTTTLLLRPSIEGVKHYQRRQSSPHAHLFKSAKDPQLCRLFFITLCSIHCHHAGLAPDTKDTTRHCGCRSIIINIPNSFTL